MFGGFSGLGVAVREVVVYSSPASDPFSRSTQWTISEMLNVFSASQDFSASCIAHLFTHVDFGTGVLGLAWVAVPSPAYNGGICAAAGSTSYNTGLTTDNA